MPKADTPAVVARRYLAPITDAIRCIAHGTLIANRERVYEIDEDYSIVLNNGDPLRLRSSPVIHLAAGQRFRVIRDGADSQEPYRIRTVEHWYQFLLDDEVELLAYHWTPEASASGQTTYPHLHIGAAMLSATAPVFPGTFHKKHLPTGRVAIESVVRFAIEELGVAPLRRNWRAILERGQRAFDDGRRG